ncbi:MAG TPA: CBS domain-containing protein [Polyangiales bacterium]|nr:CBS domain-containing protein [Polyangiales bacterium]
MDFDALASAVAAQLLHPSARIVVGRRAGRDVTDFMALHKNRYPTCTADEIPASAVTRVILVDVRRAGRLGHVPELRARIVAREPALEVHVWDHHPAAEDDVCARVSHCEPVGSATTLLIEEIRRRGLTVDVMEATLFALGIHVDTGSLRYAGTSARDAAALAWLLERGARLAVINRYLNLPFSDGQLCALRAVLAALRVERIAGVRVGAATLDEHLAVTGLDQVASEALVLEDVQALFVCVALRGARVQVVARSRAAWIDVGALLRAAGGGGHATAGAAVVRSSDAAATAESLLGLLRANPPRPALVRDLMSSPAHSVAPDTSIRDLADSLSREQHTGVPVLADGVLVGVISRRDVDAALTKGAGEERVARHMTRHVHTIEEDLPLEEALARMTREDVGRLPVMRGDRVVGIVTRRDVLASLYGSEPQ